MGATMDVDDQNKFADLYESRKKKSEEILSNCLSIFLPIHLTILNYEMFMSQAFLLI